MSRNCSSMLRISCFCTIYAKKPLFLIRGFSQIRSLIIVVTVDYRQDFLLFLGTHAKALKRLACSAVGTNPRLTVLSWRCRNACESVSAFWANLNSPLNSVNTWICGIGPFPREWTVKITEKRNESHLFVIFLHLRIYSTVCLTMSLWRQWWGRCGETPQGAVRPGRSLPCHPTHCQAAFAA